MLTVRRDISLNILSQVDDLLYCVVDLFLKSVDEFTGIDFLAELDKDGEMYTEGKLNRNESTTHWAEYLKRVV